MLPIRIAAIGAKDMAIKIASTVDETAAKPVKRARRAPQASKSKLAKLQKPAETPVAAKTQSEAPAEKHGRGRPSTGKIIVTLRLDPDVVEALKADGAGWQPRANAHLRKALGLN
jgi:uncharacterized protein (DUF4415 family)